MSRSATCVTKGNRYTVLHIAIQSGNFEIAKILGDKFPILTGITDAYGQTPLHWLATSRQIKDCPVDLLEGLIDIMSNSATYKTSSDKYTALHLALQLQNYEMAKILIEKFPVLVDIVDTHGQTPLHWVSGANLGAIKISRVDKALFIQIVNCLLRNMSYASIHYTNKTGYTALHISIQLQNYEISKLLCEKSPILTDMTDIYDQTPLYWLIAKNFTDKITDHNDIMEILMSNMSDSLIKPTKNHNNTVLHCAIEHNNFLAAELLIKKCPGLAFIANDSGILPLHSLIEKIGEESTSDLYPWTATVSALLNKEQSRSY